MTTILRLCAIMVVAVVLSWLGNLAVTTLAANPPASSAFRQRHDDYGPHDHHHDGGGWFGELGASLALVMVVGTTTVFGTRWSRRLRQRPLIQR